MEHEYVNVHNFKVVRRNDNKDVINGWAILDHYSSGGMSALPQFQAHMGEMNGRKIVTTNKLSPMFNTLAGVCRWAAERDAKGYIPIIPRPYKE